jgi:hypothetical protein
MNYDVVLWQSKHDLKNKEELLVLDSYPGIQADVQVFMVDS